MKSRLHVGLSAIFLAVVMVFAFQNCGQNGSISNDLASLSKTSGNATEPAVDPVVTPPAAIPPVAKEDEDYDKDDKKDYDKEDDDSHKCEIDHHNKSCGEIKIAEVNLAVDYISLSGGMIVLSADSKNFSISETKKSIKVKALADATLSDIRIVLKEDGNFISSLKDKYSLKTPSAQQSGLKVKLDSAKEVKKDMMYELVVDIELSNQIVENKSKCLFKPVIHSAKLL
jgi:Domain of unknown function (DUF4382)